MSAAGQDADQSSAATPLGRALGMLIEALQILDDQKAPPELGARLQEVIDGLNEYRSR